MIERKIGHSALKWNKEKQELETFDPNPPMDKNRDICDKLKIRWHECAERYFPPWNMAVSAYPSYRCSCGEIFHGAQEDMFNKHCQDNNPDFSTDAGAVQLLRLMMKRGGCDDFLRLLTGGITSPERMILVYYFTTPGKLRDAVWEWLCRSKEGKC